MCQLSHGQSHFSPFKSNFIPNWKEFKASHLRENSTFLSLQAAFLVFKALALPMSIQPNNLHLLRKLLFEKFERKPIELPAYQKILSETLSPVCWLKKTTIFSNKSVVKQTRRRFAERGFGFKKVIMGYFWSNIETFGERKNTRGVEHAILLSEIAKTSGQPDLELWRGPKSPLDAPTLL